MEEGMREGGYAGVVFALLAAIGFSAKAILVKLAYQYRVDTITLLALRMSFAMPFFVAVLFWVRRKSIDPLALKDKLLVLGVGLTGYYLSSLFDFLGLQYITAGLERLILFLYPTMTVVLAALLYKRPIGKKVLAAMALSYLGIALVFLHDAGGRQGESTLLGAMLVFASTLSYSIYLVGAGHAIARLGVERFTSMAMIVAGIACLLQFALTHSLGSLVLPFRVYEYSVAMALFSTVLPVFLLSYAIRHIGSSRASLIGSIGPVSTIYLAYLFLGEQVTPLQVAGAFLVMCGVMIVSLTRNQAGAVK